MPESSAAEVTFHPSGRGKAQCPANPDYPNGISLTGMFGSAPVCLFDIPYPAPECGHWTIACKKCGITVAATAAGRADDPINIEVACRQMVESH